MGKVNDPYILCRKCKRHHTMDCPNSSKCFSLDNKPYFIAENISINKKQENGN